MNHEGAYRHENIHYGHHHHAVQYDQSQIEDKDARGHRAVLLPQIEYG